MITLKDYSYFIDCEKKYWLQKNPKEVDQSTMAKKEAEWLSNLKETIRQRFSNHVLIDTSDLIKAESDTQEAIDRGETAIFNAVLRYGDVTLTIDFLNKKADKWQIISIKNILSSSPYNLIKTGSNTKEVKNILHEMAFQKHIIDSMDLFHDDVNYCVMCLNYNYKREEELDLIQLVKVFNFDKFIPEYMIDVEANIEKIKKIKEQPEKIVGSHCKSPTTCPYRHSCWKNIPDESIHNIPRITQKKRELFLSKGWETIFDIENLAENVTDLQRNVINKIKGGRTKKNPMRIMMFLNRLKFPIYHLDFETYFPNIPLYRGMRPMDAVPFQYSLHIEERNKNITEKHFIHTEKTDPRLEFIKNLIVHLGSAGSILVYNKAFESGIVKNLAESFPEYKSELMKIDERFVDLMVPFKDQDYWHPNMLFSYSLKYVLPALVPELTYDNLFIKNGEQAMLDYERMLSLDGEEKNEIKEGLIEYCGQDTMAMVKILEVLRKK